MITNLEFIFTKLIQSRRLQFSSTLSVTWCPPLRLPCKNKFGEVLNLILSGYVMKVNFYESRTVYQPECIHHKTELEGRVHSWSNNVLIHQLQILGLSRLVQEHSWGQLCKRWTIISSDIFLGLCQKTLPMNSGLYPRKCIADVLKIFLKSLWHSQIREENTNPQVLGRRKHKSTITSRMCFCPNYIRKKKKESHAL